MKVSYLDEKALVIFVKIGLFLVILVLTSCTIRVQFLDYNQFYCNDPRVVNQVKDQLKQRLFHNKSYNITIDDYISLKSYKNFRFCIARMNIGRYHLGWIKYYVIRTDDNKFFVKVYNKVFHEKI